MENNITNHSSLEEKLARNYERICNKMPKEAEAYRSLLDQLKAANLNKYAIGQNQVMPPFLLPDENGSLVEMEDLTSEGPLIITFNNGHWCTFCEIELANLCEYHMEIKAGGASVVAISSMNRWAARQLADRLNLTFPILTDVYNGYALLLGLAVRLAKPFCRLSYPVTRHENTANDVESFIVTAPATYIVSRHGIVDACHISSDFRDRMSAEKIIEYLKNK